MLIAKCIIYCTTQKGRGGLLWNRKQYVKRYLIEQGSSLLLAESDLFNLLKPTGYGMHQQFNIQQLYVLPTLYLCVLYLSENKQRLVPLTT